MLGTLTERCITLSRLFDVEALTELLRCLACALKRRSSVHGFSSLISSPEVSHVTGASPAVVLGKTDSAASKREYRTCFILNFSERLGSRTALAEEALASGSASSRRVVLGLTGVRAPRLCMPPKRSRIQRKLDITLCFVHPRHSEHSSNPNAS